MSQSITNRAVRSNDSEADTREFVVPVIAEELEIRKEIVRTGTVRLRKIVQEVPQCIHESLTSEQVEIERVPMDVVVDEPPSVRIEGDVTVVPIVEEVLVITKELRLKEELRITKRRVTSDYREEVTLRSEEVIVERLDNQNPT